MSDPAGSSGLTLVLCGAALISFAAVFVRLADVGPATAGFYRLAFGGTFLTVASLTMGGDKGAATEKFRTGGLGFMAVVAGIFVVDLTAWHRAIHDVGPGLAAVLANLQVLVVAVLGMLLHQERPAARFWTAAVLALSGVVLLVGVDFEHLGPAPARGVAAGLATALLYGFYIVALRYVQAGRSWRGQLRVMACISLLAMPPMALVAMGLGESFLIPNARSWAALVALGVVCQGLGWLALSRGLPRVPVAVGGLGILLQPALAMIWDVLFFDRPLTVTDGLGLTLALAGMYLGAVRGR